MEKWARRDPDDRERFERVRAALLAARDERPQPGRDDKVIAAWNGLAITALCEAGVALDEPHWVSAALDAASAVLGIHLRDNRLRRSSRDGTAGDAAGVLEDYGCLAEGLLALHQATGDPRWLTEATNLLDTALANFAVADTPGAYHDTADDAEVLVHRPSDPTDNASPSGASALANALVTASVLVGPDRSAWYRAAAEEAVHRVIGRPGVILVGEGSASRVKPLLAQEKKKTARLVGDVPIYDIVVGNGEGEVPLAKLERHLGKLPANITAKQMDSLESRLAALGSRMGPAAMPKGPLPPGAKMRGVQRTVRRK